MEGSGLDLIQSPTSLTKTWLFACRTHLAVQWHLDTEQVKHCLLIGCWRGEKFSSLSLKASIGQGETGYDCVKTEKVQQQHLDRVNSLFTYYYSLTLIRRVDFRCFIFQWYYLHTRVTNKSDSRKNKYSTVCSFIITPRKFTLFLLQLDMINTTVLFLKDCSWVRNSCTHPSPWITAVSHSYSLDRLSSWRWRLFLSASTFQEEQLNFNRWRLCVWFSLFTCEYLEPHQGIQRPFLWMKKSWSLTFQEGFSFFHFTFLLYTLKWPSCL